MAGQEDNRKQAWVTLATNDSYALGTLVLGSSLRRTGTQYELVVMVTPGVSSHMRSVLETVFNHVREVNVLDSGDAVNLALLSRPELGITFTKLHCWRLTEFRKCVFLDADTLVLQNCDELFERSEFSAAPDSGWPDCFNSGVFVYEPNLVTYTRLLDFALSAGSFDGGDQGLLNSFFSGWRDAERQFHLPFIYNMVSSATYSYLPAFKAFGSNVKIVHFIGAVKPWLMTLDQSGTGQVCPPGGSEHLQPFLQAWWDLFRAEVHPKLRPEMEYGHEDTIAESGTLMDQLTQGEVDLTIYESSPAPPPIHLPPQLPPPSRHPPQPPPPPEKGVDLDNLGIAIKRFPPENVHPPLFHTEPQRGPLAISPYIPSHDKSQTHTEHCHSDNPPKNETQWHMLHVPPKNEPPLPPENTSQWLPPPPPPEEAPFPECSLHPQKSEPQRGPIHIPNLPKKISVPIPPPSESTSDHNLQLHSFHIAVSSALNVIESSSPGGKSPGADLPSQENSGLAGVYATITFEGSKTSQQLENEDRLRKLAWEQGNIDYLGKDAFDNILKKMQQTMAEAAQQQRKEKSPSPPKSKAKKEKTPPPPVTQDVTTGGAAPPPQPTPVPVQEPTVTQTQVPESQGPVPTEAAVLHTSPPRVLDSGVSESQNAAPTIQAQPPVQVAAVPEDQISPPAQVAGVPEAQAPPPAQVAVVPEPLASTTVPSTPAPVVPEPVQQKLQTAAPPQPELQAAAAPLPEPIQQVLQTVAPPQPDPAAPAPPGIPTSEELEELRLAQERLAIEKKLGEQKRIAEQKLAEERAAAATTAQPPEAQPKTEKPAAESKSGSKPSAQAKAPEPKVPPRKGAGKATNFPRICLIAGFGLALIGIILNWTWKR